MAAQTLTTASATGNATRAAANAHYANASGANATTRANAITNAANASQQA